MAKIKNRRINQEVQFRKALLRFTLSFTGVLAVGLISVFFINRYPLKQRLLDAVQVPEQFNLEISDVQFRFSQGLMPVIALNFKKIQLAEDQCVAKRISAHDALLVLNPWRLAVGEIKVAWAKVGHLQIDYSELCQVEEVVSSSSSHSTKVIDKTYSKKTNFKSRILQEVFAHIVRLQNFKKLSYLMVDSFEFRGIQANGQVSLGEGRFTARLKQKIEMDLHLNQLSYAEHRLPARKIRLKGSLSDKVIRFSLDSAIREGKILLDFDIENNEKFSVHLSLNVDNVPTSSLSQILGQELAVSYLWGDCHVKISSPWEKLIQAPIEFGSCGLQGPYGNIFFDKIVASLEGVKELSARAEGLDLDQLIHSKRNLYFAGVLARYGLLEARLDYNKKNFSIDGVIQGSEFVFSNNQMRDIQKVLKIPFVIKGNSKVWQAELGKIELESGEINGDLQIQVDPRGKQAQGRLRFHRIRLSPRIYKLMIDAEPTDLKVYGKFTIEKSKLQKWSAFLVAAEIKSDWYQLENFKVKAEGSEVTQNSPIRIESSSGYVKSDSTLLTWLKPTLLNHEWNSPRVSFKELSLNLLVDRDQSVQWNRGYARLQSGYQLTSEGRRAADHQLSGWLQWDRPDKKIMKWGYEGVFLKGYWTPKTESLMTWLDSNPEYLEEHKQVQFSEELQKGLGAKINDASRKAMDRIKSVIVKPVPEKASR